jgi:RimJ/RimL family protein N-acetyltransferase
VHFRYIVAIRSISGRFVMPQVHIRRLQPEEYAAFRDIRLEGLRLHPEAFGASLDEEEQQSSEELSARIARSFIFGGFDADDRLMGVIGLARSNSAKIRHIAVIWGMYVREKARGTGLARNLLAEAIAEGRATCRSLRLSVVSSNPAAIRLYQSAGFSQWAVDVQALRVADTYHDEILMRIDFD